MEQLMYTIVLETAEEGGYIVTVPALPAIVTEGDTYAEALDMTKDAIQLYLESLANEGRPIPTEPPPMERTAVQVQVTAPVSS